MADKIFSSERVNTGRQIELDLLKAFSIIMMIVTHCIDDLYIGYEVHTPFLVINDILAQSVGAMSFMICMGMGCVFSKNASPDKYVRRGISLLMTGQLLNLVRYDVPGLIIFMVTGDESVRDHCMLTFSSDILEFAGLFFILMGLFSYLKLKSGHIFAIAIVLNVIASFLKLSINTGYYGIDQFFGLFVFTDTESYFPLFHWLIYPAFGIVLGEILTHVKDKKRFYGYSIIPTMIIWIGYYYAGIFVEQDIFKFYNEWQSLAYVSLFDAIPQLIINFSMLCMFYFLSRLITDRAKTVAGYISKNINRYYCVHSVIVFVAAAIVEASYRFKVTTKTCYVFIVVVTAMTAVGVFLYDRYGEPLRAFARKHTVLCYTTVMVLSVMACVFASLGENHYPNLNNNYNNGE